jgi:hypothetical protein
MTVQKTSPFSSELHLFPASAHFGGFTMFMQNTGQKSTVKRAEMILLDQQNGDSGGFTMFMQNTGQKSTVKSGPLDQADQSTR